VLVVRQSKFGKSRLVPLHRTTREALISYAERRDAHLGSRSGPHFFVAERGGRLLHQYVHRVFWLRIPTKSLGQSNMMSSDVPR
jgi:site-specific recombinase XerD